MNISESMPVKLMLELDLEFYAILRKICEINNQNLEDAVIEGLTDLLSYTNSTLLCSLSLRDSRIKGRRKCSSKE